MWVSTSTSGPSSSRSAASSLSAMSCAEPSASLRSTSRSSETESLPADVVHGDVVHGEPPVARDHHDALLHGLVVERARGGGDADLGARHLGADRVGDLRLQAPRPGRAAACGSPPPPPRRTACRRPAAPARARPRPRRARAPRRAGRCSAEPAGAVSVSVSMVRRPSRQPARHTNSATTRAAAASAHGKPNATPPSPISTAIDDHMSEPKCSASASSASLAVSRGHAVEQPRAEEIDHDRHDDHGEGRERRLDRVAVAAEQPLRRLPDHHARQHEQQRGLRQRRHALDLAVAVVVLLVGRLAGDAHGEIGHHRGAEIDQRMRGLRQDRERAGEQRRPRPWPRSARRTRRSRRARPSPSRSCIGAASPAIRRAPDAVRR